LANVTEGLPKFNEITTPQLKNVVEECVQRLTGDFSEFEIFLNNQSEEYCYGDIFEKLEMLQSPLACSWGIVNHLMGVKNSDELRVAHETVQPLVIELYQKLGQSQQLFKAVKYLKMRPSVWETLDETQRRIVQTSIRQMEVAGVDLADDQREEFNKLDLELSELETKFSNNILDSTKVPFLMIN